MLKRFACWFLGGHIRAPAYWTVWEDDGSPWLVLGDECLVCGKRWANVGG